MEATRSHGGALHLEANAEAAADRTAPISGREAGLNNDRERFPEIGDLELEEIPAPTLLVHGTADTDVRPDQTENAAEHIPNADVIRVQNGRDLCMWTDPTSADIHELIAAVISRT